MSSLSAFDAIRQRESARRFSSRPVDQKLLYSLLELAHRAPSGFNLQPWHFIVVRDAELKSLLRDVALGQSQVEEAPLVVALVADPDCWKTDFDRITEESVRSGAFTEEYAAFNRRNVERFFRIGPFGLAGMVKRLVLPLRHLRRPTSGALTNRQEAKQYVCAQTMLAAATLMIAASGAGLASCPMEGFDEERLKRLLAVPSRMSVPILVALGYPLESSTPSSYRVPLPERISVDLFPNKLSRLKERKKEQTQQIGSDQDPKAISPPRQTF